MQHGSVVYGSAAQQRSNLFEKSVGGESDWTTIRLRGGHRIQPAPSQPVALVAPCARKPLDANHAGKLFNANHVDRCTVSTIGEALRDDELQCELEAQT